MNFNILSRLLEKTGTDLKEIGRLEVGTETIVDKSKSVKSVIMQVILRLRGYILCKILYNKCTVANGHESSVNFNLVSYVNITLYLINEPKIKKRD